MSGYRIKATTKYSSKVAYYKECGIMLVCLQEGHELNQQKYVIFFQSVILLNLKGEVNHISEQRDVLLKKLTEADSRIEVSSFFSILAFQ